MGVLTRRKYLLLLASAASLTGCKGLRASRSSGMGILQATITSEIDRYVDPPLISIGFHLQNTVEAEIDCKPDTWELVINGSPYAYSNMLFGNGLGPVGGFGELEAGGSFDFGKGLDYARFFPEDKDYRVLWRAADFQSNTLTIRGSSLIR